MLKQGNNRVSGNERHLRTLLFVKEFLLFQYFTENIWFTVEVASSSLYVFWIKCVLDVTLKPVFEPSLFGGGSFSYY